MESWQKLCTACGICCDGTLFSHVPFVDDDDPTEVYENAGLAVEKDRMPLPCKKFEDGACQTYKCRPVVCHRFRCDLLTRFDHEEDTDFSVEVIRTVKEKRERLMNMLNSQFPELAGKSYRECFSFFEKAMNSTEDEKAFRHIHGDIILEKATFDLMLIRHFDGKRAKKLGLKSTMEEFVMSS